MQSNWWKRAKKITKHRIRYEPVNVAVAGEAASSVKKPKSASFLFASSGGCCVCVRVFNEPGQADFASSISSLSFAICMFSIVLLVVFLFLVPCIFSTIITLH